MSTPLVYGGIAFALWAGPAAGATYGAGFALGRSIPALAGVLRGKPVDPANAALYPAAAFPRTARVAGIISPLAILALSRHVG